MTLSMAAQLRNEMSGSYLPRLIAVAYAVFDPTQGPKIVHQVPEGVIATALNAFPTRPTNPNPTSPNNLNVPLSNDSSPEGTGVEGAAGGGGGLIRSSPGQGIGSTQILFDFSSVLEFVIPKPELCGNLITKATRTSKILGFPVRIFDEEKYHKGKEVYNRNAFIFNLCFVFERDAELSGFEPVVRKTARTLRTLEESVSLLSDPPSSFNMGDLLEQLFMDLNSFSETSIPIHDTDLDLMLFPFYANPRDINAWDVPIAVAPLEKIKNGSWDVTLFKVCSFIDGVNPVKKIAELAEVDQNLGRLCIQHLLFYSAIILVDLFQFSNCYTTLPGITDIAQHGESEDDGVTDLRAECEAYVYSGSGDTLPVPFPTLLILYSKLIPGLTVSNWIDVNEINEDLIDVRRMIQFGVIKGFLKRIYSFPIWLDHFSFNSSNTDGERGGPLGGGGKSKGSKQSRYKTLHREHTSSTISSVATTIERPPLDRNYSSTYSYAPLPTPTSQPSTPPQIAPRDGPAIPRESTASRYSSTSTTTTTTHHTNTHNSNNNGSIQPSKSSTPSQLINAVTTLYPNSLKEMCDGTHCTDEICLRFGMSLKQLEVGLKIIGGGGVTANGVGGERENEIGVGGGGKNFGKRMVMIHI